MKTHPSTAAARRQIDREFARPARTFSPGDRVTALVWGKVETGTVLEVGRAVVWVAWDDTPARVRWMHPVSLTLIGG